MRTPDVRAAPLNPLRLAVLTLLLGALLAACGGSSATVQEVPGGDNDNDGAQPQPVVAPPAGGVYYRPGVQSTGRMNMLVVPEWARKSGGRR